MIPKILWQTHEWEYEDLPPNFKSASLTWKNLNLDWEYRYVGGAERAKQVESFDSTLYLFYKHMDKTSQADLWRYVITYKNGGVYSDMDSICSIPLNYVLEDMPLEKQILATSIDPIDGVVNNANFGSSKNSIVLGETLDNISAMLQSVKLTSVLQASKTDFNLIEAIEHQIKLHPDDFSSVALKHQNLVWFNYVGPLHGSDIKDPNYRVPENFLVNFYGKDRLYKDLAKENNWDLI